MRYFCFILLYFALGNIAAQQVSFTADCNATDVVVGNPFRVSFQLENEEIRNINFPDFDRAGFEVLQGPVSETRFSYVNGQRSYVEAYTFILAATKTGTLYLGSAKVVTSRGKSISSKPIKINAVKAGTGPTQEEADPSNLPSALSGKIAFRIEPSTREAVVGESVLLNFKIYTQVDLAMIEMVKEPDFSNIFTHPLRYFDQEARVEVLNGKQYATKIIHSLNIYPTKSGKLEIDPATVNVALGRASANNPFARPQVYPVNSNKVLIEVKELEKTPKTFNGGVGEFQMQATIEKSNITTDDAIKIKMTIAGLGDIKRVLEPPILFNKQGKDAPFSINPPKMKEELREGTSGLGGIKEFDYVLEPRELGDFEIRPTFTYYDVRSDRFITIDTVLPVKVIQGNKKLDRKPSFEEESDSADKAAVALISFTEASNKATWQHKGRPLFGSFLFWIVTLLPFIVFGALAGSRYYLQQRLAFLAKKAEAEKADREANEGIEAAKQYLADRNASSFYQTVAETLKNYLAYKLGIPSAEVTKELLAEKLEASKLFADDQPIRLLVRVLKVCEVSVFAAQNNTQSMEKIFQDSKELLEVFRKSIK